MYLKKKIKKLKNIIIISWTVKTHKKTLTSFQTFLFPSTPPPSSYSSSSSIFFFLSLSLCCVVVLEAPRTMIFPMCPSLLTLLPGRGLGPRRTRSSSGPDLRSPRLSPIATRRAWRSEAQQLVQDVGDLELRALFGLWYSGTSWSSSTSTSISTRTRWSLWWILQSESSDCRFWFCFDCWKWNI
jgi:hypothetical protein